jgi:hypothetical protein
VQREFAVSSCYDVELLTQACEAVDQISAIAVELEQSGLTCSNSKLNPLARHQLNLRGFVVRTLTKIGIDEMPVRGPGRPPRGLA